MYGPAEMYLEVQLLSMSCLERRCEAGGVLVGACGLIA